MRTPSSPVVEDLDEAECWRLLATTDLGRLAIASDDGVDIFPINYLAKDGVVFFRSAPGSKLIELTERPDVAFQVDGKYHRLGWSVVVKGLAERMSVDAEIEESGVLGLRSHTPTDKWNYVRIVPKSITGRRFTKTRRAALKA